MDTTMNKLARCEETVWLNPRLQDVAPKFVLNDRGYVHMLAAQNRFMRFLPYFSSAFPETAPKKGVIESDLVFINQVQQYMNEAGASIHGRVMLKDDAHLPIAGSVKARGGIHEVLHIAEKIMQKHDFLMPGGDYSRINSPEFRELFAQYAIHVASTGNLGISIGRTASRMGFRVYVHMSQDAKEWKKQLLRNEGCTVEEYPCDYTHTVAYAREKALTEPDSFFVDDENSEDLFFGYSSAAMRVKVQLRNLGISVDQKHPLFVYLPCGVGGAPSGITFGLKQLFGQSVHCFFAEPVYAPCFTLAMASQKHDSICIQDIGLDGKTIADGLAVGRASGFSCRMMDTLISGCCTYTDEHILNWQKSLKELENITAEPSACAGFGILADICRPDTDLNIYIHNHGLFNYMDQATHIVWATGGGLMPFTE